MCESVSEKPTGWKGWLDVPAPRLSGATGAWRELSHPLTETLSRAPAFPQPRIRQIATKPEHPANVTELHMVVHHGTHVDAPRHFIADGPTMDEVPLERLIGEGVIWHVDVPDHGVIEPGHLDRASPSLREGDIVLIDTGRGPRINTPSYDDHASLSPEAAEWLLARGAKLVGIDCATPDLASNRRRQGFDWPVHHILLSRGVLIAEHMANLGALAGRRAEMAFLALNIVGSDGAPARVIARAVD
jgi:arylformamidase